MKKKLLTLLLTLCAAFAVIGFVGCGEDKSGDTQSSSESTLPPTGENETQSPNAYTVTFDTAGGSTAPTSQTVERLAKVSCPEEPTREGYSFEGWYLGDEKWSFSENVVTENMTLTAKWKQYGEGLVYKLDESQTYYIVTGAGTNGESDLTIPSVHDGLPVKQIAKEAFIEDVTIKKVTISKNVEKIAEEAFYGCRSLKEVIVGEDVTEIGSMAFYGCRSLTSLTIGNSVTTIGEWAFKSCSRLTSITIPDSVTSIARALEGCSSLTSISVGANNTEYQSIDGNLYSKDGKTLIQYAVGKTTTEFQIPNSVTTIDPNAFDDCSNLTSVTIGDHVTSIGSSAFNAFSDLGSLTSITVGENNSNYASQDGILYNKAKTEFVHIPNNIGGDVEIPNGVTHIYGDAFEDCSSLTSITIPDSVTEIFRGAFRGCSSLTSITIPDRVTYISSEAFYDCNSLTSVTIGNSVTTIDHYAFANCSKLTSIVIPNSVTKIARGAFKGCSGLTNVTFEDTTTWYYTLNQSYRDGSSISVANPSDNATYFKSTYVDYYWYKI